MANSSVPSVCPAREVRLAWDCDLDLAFSACAACASGDSPPAPPVCHVDHACIDWSQGPWRWAVCNVVKSPGISRGALESIQPDMSLSPTNANHEPPDGGLEFPRAALPSGMKLNSPRRANHEPPDGGVEFPCALSRYTPRRN